MEAIDEEEEMRAMGLSRDPSDTAF